MDLVIFKHFRETNKKSTAIHANLICQNHSEIINFSSSTDEVFDKYFSSHPTEGVAILFPTEDAIDIREMEDLKDLKKLIVIDGTWSSANAVIQTEKLNRFQFVKIQEKKSTFWRSSGNQNNVSTIEAIFHFFDQYQSIIKNQQTSSHLYDNLLFFFSFFHKVVGEKMLDFDAK